MNLLFRLDADGVSTKTFDRYNLLNGTGYTLGQIRNRLFPVINKGEFKMDEHRQFAVFALELLQQSSSPASYPAVENVYKTIMWLRAIAEGNLTIVNPPMPPPPEI